MRLAAALLALVIAIPSSVSAWGFEAHKFIADRMIALLPAELRPLFEKRRAFIVERAIDPDLWRNAGWEQEPPNHFLDIDSRRSARIHSIGCRGTIRPRSRNLAKTSLRRRACCRGGRRNSTDGCNANSNR